MKISDEIRNDFLHNDDVGEVAYRQLLCIADRIDREMAEYERLKKDNDELTAELDDWKGNAEGFEPDAYMKLPLDADGVPIRIGDEMDIGGEIAIVKGYQISYEGSELLFIAMSDDDRRTFTLFGKNLKHFRHDTMPVYSWENLEKDVMKCACDILGMANLRCRDCDWAKNDVGCQEGARLEILKRAKKLAGIE